MYNSKKLYSSYISSIFFLLFIYLSANLNASQQIGTMQEKFLKLLSFTEENVGDKLQTVIGIPVLYYGFYSLFAKWKQHIKESQVGPTYKKILTLGDPNLHGHILNYIVPGIGLLVMPKVDSLKSFKFFFKLSNFAKKIISEKE